MGVKVREKARGSDVWWVFAACEGQRVSRKVGDRDQADRVALRLRESLKERVTNPERRVDTPLRDEVDDVLVEMGVRRSSSRPTSKLHFRDKGARPKATVSPALRKALAPDFTIQERIGGGGMGDVYLASRTGLGGKWAIKVLAPDLTADEGLVDRFISEARIEASLDHPNIVKVFDIRKSGGFHFLIMNYVVGQDLGRWMSSFDTAVEHDVVGIALQVCRALECAHRNNVTHRDIKPSNIRVREDGSVVVLDFGIARARDLANKTRTARGERLGTPVYMSPEQIRGDPIDHRCDLYSLGVLLYEMASGENPFEANLEHGVYARHLHHAARPLTEVRPELSPALSRLVQQLLEKEPDKRPASAEAVVSELTKLLRRGHRVSLDAQNGIGSQPQVGTGSDSTPASTTSVNTDESHAILPDLSVADRLQRMFPSAQLLWGKTWVKSASSAVAIFIFSAAAIWAFWPSPVEPVITETPALVSLWASPWAKVAVTGEGGALIASLTTPAILSIGPGEFDIQFQYQAEVRTQAVQVSAGESIRLGESFVSAAQIELLVGNDLAW